MRLESIPPGVVSWLVLGLYVGLLSQLTLLWTGLTIRPAAPRRALLWMAVGAYMRWMYASALIVVAIQQDILFALASVIGLSLARWGFVWYLKKRDALSSFGFKEGEML
jgi:hypothetical protein